MANKRVKEKKVLGNQPTNKKHAMMIMGATMAAVPMAMSVSDVAEAATRTITFKYDDFSNTTMNNLLQINNNASITSNVLRLTKNLNNQSGSAFYKQRVSLMNKRSFSAYFSFKIHGGSGADGIVFTVQTANNSTATQGLGIGYQDIAPSLGVEFDTFNNSGSPVYDPNGNHIGIDLNGSVYSKKTYIPSWDINGNGVVNHAWVDYDGENKKLKVYFNDNDIRPTTPVIEYDVDLTTVLNMDDVFVGFTSATGGSNDNHDILKWYFNNNYDPIDIKYNTYSNAAASVALNSSKSPDGKSSTISATLKDATGNPLPGQNVSFTSTLGTITASAVTNESGVATATLTGASKNGTATVKAVAAGGSYGTINVEMIDANAWIISEDTTEAKQVSNIYGGHGIIITSADHTNGEWQYSFGGVDWSKIDATSFNNALLLGSGYKIRFVPKQNWYGITSIKYRNWTDPGWNTNPDRVSHIHPNMNLGGFNSDVYGPIENTIPLTVLSVNDQPYITENNENGIGFTSDIVTTSGVPASKSFKVLDVDGDNLTVSATSSNTSLLPNENISISGTGNDRTITVNPISEQYGTSTITVEVSDDKGAKYQSSFNVTVAPPQGIFASNKSAKVIKGVTQVPIDSELKVDFSYSNYSELYEAKVVINNFKNGDVLHFANQNGITGSYNESNGVLTLSGTTSIENYQKALRSVEFSTTSSDTTARDITFTIGNALYFEPTQHFYEYVALNQPISWVDAKAAAAQKDLFGRQGYLVTILSEEENNFVKEKALGLGWLGARDIAHPGGDWRWVTGPEGKEDGGKGMPFWNGYGNSAGYGIGSNTPVDGRFNKWQEGEPNNWNNTEEVAHIFGPGSGAGEWNDYDENNSSVTGYIVEYGGLNDGDTNIHISMNKTVEVIADNLGFEEDFVGWTKYGNASIGTGSNYSTSGYLWTVNPYNSKMAVLIPSGPSGSFNKVAEDLKLSQDSRDYLLGQFPNTTNFGYVYQDIKLEAGEEFSMSWNYISTDYENFNDGSFVSFVHTTDPTSVPMVSPGLTDEGEKVQSVNSEVSILGATNEGTGVYSTKSYGSTGWQTASFKADKAGTYRLGFTVFNLADTVLPPYLFVDKAPGTTLKNGENFGPIEPDKNPPPAPGAPTFTVDTTAKAKQVTVTIKYPSYPGIEKKEYSLDGENWLDYNGPITIEKNGTIYARTTDGENTLSAATYEITNIVNTPPEKPSIDTITTKGGKTVSITSAAPKSGETAWLAPEGTTTFVPGPTMTQLVGNGTKKSIQVPSVEGEYKLYVVDQAGNISEASDGTITVDNTAPNQPSIDGGTVKSGTNIIITSGIPASGETAWLAPVGTTNFKENDPTMTKLLGNGLVNTIKAPNDEYAGPYKLYIVDAAGNISLPSDESVIVDDTPPTKPFIEGGRVRGDVAVKIKDAPKAGETAWLAPSGTTNFAEGEMMTKLVGDGTNKIIQSPEKAGGPYKLYIVDAAGNISEASDNSITVDNTAPAQPKVDSTAVKGGKTITLTSKAPDTDETLWLVPVGTTEFKESDTIVKLVGDGTTKEIKVPNVEGEYVLYVVDEAGNLSEPSDNHIIVDNTPPAQPGVESADTKGGTTVTITSGIPAAGETAWLIPIDFEIDPNNPSQFTEGPTMTKQAEGPKNEIKVPVNNGKYKLIVVDAAGNISEASIGQDTSIVTDEFIVGLKVKIETGDIGSGSQVTETFVERTTNPDGSYKDDVELTGDRAADTVQQLINQGLNNARIVVPDELDEVSEVNVSVPKVAVDALKNGNINLEIYTVNARLTIPSNSLINYNKDFYFRLVPIKEEEDKAEVEERAKKNNDIKQIAKDQKVEVVGRPMEIDTNMQSHRVDIILPLKDLPTDPKKKEELLENLAVFVEHSDGSTEIKKGTIVSYDESNLGIKFSIDKFSIFTILNISGWKEYNQPSKGGGGSGGGGKGTTPAAPNVTVDDTNNKIIGIDETMEYQIDGGQWVTYNPNDPLDLSGAHTVNIRVKANGSIPAGAITTLTFTKNPEQSILSHSPYIYGYSDGTFHPNADVKRSQMAAMLARNLPREMVLTNSKPYADVSSSYWAYNEIMKAKNAGIMTGVTDTKFNASGSITRAQMATIAYRWIQKECAKDASAFESCATLKGTYKSNYSDVSSKHWAYEAISFMKASNFMIGYSDNTFKPNENLTRAQAVKVLNRLFKRGPLTGVTSSTFKDIPTTHWSFNEIEEAARTHEYKINGTNEVLVNP